jgi:hypothetical protein
MPHPRRSDPSRPGKALTRAVVLRPSTALLPGRWAPRLTGVSVRATAASFPGSRRQAGRAGGRRAGAQLDPSRPPEQEAAKRSHVRRPGQKTRSRNPGCPEQSRCLTSRPPHRDGLVPAGVIGLGWVGFDCSPLHRLVRFTRPWTFLRLPDARVSVCTVLRVHALMNRSRRAWRDGRMAHTLVVQLMNGLAR